MRKTCRMIRIIVGIVLIAVGVITGIKWFYLGVIPLVIGLVNFCPLCLITKKCDINEN
jgi:hypothetical protein